MHLIHSFQTRSGDTLTDSATTIKQALAKFNKSGGDLENDDLDLDTEDSDGPVLAGLDLPSPVFYCSIEAPSTSKQVEMEKALAKIQREDPSLHVRTLKFYCLLYITHFGDTYRVHQINVF